MNADNSLSYTCRCCLTDRGQLKDMTTEFLTTNRHLHLIDVYKQCSGVEIVDELKLTTKICQACDFKLQMTYEFREMCRTSDLALKEQVKDESDGEILKDTSLKAVRHVKSKRKNGAGERKNSRMRQLVTHPVIPATSTSSGGPMESESDDSTSTKDEAFARFLNHRAEHKKSPGDSPGGKLKIMVIPNQFKLRDDEEFRREQSHTFGVKKLGTVAEIQEFDERLGRDFRFRENVLTQFKRIGGKSTPGHTRNVLRHLISSQVLEYFTWDKAFGDTVQFNSYRNICDVICSSVAPDFTHHDFGKIMVRYLRKSRRLQM